jgi:hypothetical protein
MDGLIRYVKSLSFHLNWIFLSPEKKYARLWARTKKLGDLNYAFKSAVASDIKVVWWQLILRQKERSMAAKFEIYKNEAGLFRWRPIRKGKSTWSGIVSAKETGLTRLSK